jgi:hypothetical protein
MVYVFTTGNCWLLIAQLGRLLRRATERIHLETCAVIYSASSMCISRRKTLLVL